MASKPFPVSPTTFFGMLRKLPGFPRKLFTRLLQRFQFGLFLPAWRLHHNLARVLTSHERQSLLHQVLLLSDDHQSVLPAWSAHPHSGALSAALHTFVFRIFCFLIMTASLQLPLFVVVFAHTLHKSCSVLYKVSMGLQHSFIDFPKPLRQLDVFCETIRENCSSKLLFQIIFTSTDENFFLKKNNDKNLKQ